MTLDRRSLVEANLRWGRSAASAIARGVLPTDAFERSVLSRMARDVAPSLALPMLTAWAMLAADQIDRGDLPESAFERELLATIVRTGVDALDVPKLDKPRPRKRGIASQIDHRATARMVEAKIANGATRDAATAEVARHLNVVPRTVERAYDKHRRPVRVFKPTEEGNRQRAENAARRAASDPDRNTD